MRADRLISIVMLLQTHARMTACELAEELEVSERTIYRDIDALSIAGVPIYSEAGPGGGYALVDDYRTTLTGLTEGEVRALFTLNIPAPLTDLGMDKELRAALLKLSASLPNTRRGEEEKAHQRFHLDSTWWQQGGESVPHLKDIQQAVWQNLKLHVVYQPLYTTEIERLIAPYGLVAKAGVWYLVYARNERIYVQRVSDLTDVRISPESFGRPDEFDLAAFWESWCAEYEALLSYFTATVRVAPDFIPELPKHFSNDVLDQAAQAGPPDDDRWIKLELSFRSFEEARARILGFGRGVEVLEPLALKRSVLDFAEQIVDLYKD